MIDPFRKFVLSFQVDQLGALIGQIKASLADGEFGPESIPCVHYERARQAQSDAVSALRYGIFPQAEYSLKKGLASGYFASRVIADLRANSAALPASRVVPPGEAEEKIARLSHSLAGLKGAIEYANCHVGDLTRSEIENCAAMQRLAIDSLKTRSYVQAKRRAQAGLLQLSFAGQLLLADNDGVPASWMGPANPMTNAPVRKLNQLSDEIVHIYQLVGPRVDETHLAAYAHLLDAIKSIDTAFAALAEDNVVYAQAVVIAGLSEVAEAREKCAEIAALGGSLPDERSLMARYASGRLPARVGRLQRALSRCDSPAAKELCGRLESAQKCYKDALKELQAADNITAQALFQEAMSQVVRVREELFDESGALKVRF